MTIVLPAIPKFIELAEKLADLAIMLHHAVRIDAEPGLALRLGLEPGPNVHAGRIEPREERLLRPVGAVDEVERGFEKLVVRRLHALLVKRAGILAILLAPLAEPRIFSRRLGGCRRASRARRAGRSAA